MLRKRKLAEEKTHANSSVVSYDVLSAFTIFSLDARLAGKNPPRMPIQIEKIIVQKIIVGDIVKPNASSENVPKLTVEILTNDIKEARMIPQTPPTNESKMDSTRNAERILRRRKPSERSVPISIVRLATAPYIVIIAPIIAPILKMNVTIKPRM